MVTCESESLEVMSRLTGKTKLIPGSAGMKHELLRKQTDMSLDVPRSIQKPKKKRPKFISKGDEDK